MQQIPKKVPATPEKAGLLVTHMGICFFLKWAISSHLSQAQKPREEWRGRESCHSNINTLAMFFSLPPAITPHSLHMVEESQSLWTCLHYFQKRWGAAEERRERGKKRQKERDGGHIKVSYISTSFILQESTCFNLPWAIHGHCQGCILSTKLKK